MFFPILPYGPPLFSISPHFSNLQDDFFFQSNHPWFVVASTRSFLFSTVFFVPPLSITTLEAI